ncbi:hypothetical protein SUGI_0907190 [Cryptomeria japonica]|nr:hypothetical protein SUGI_0907190 [Cryptomeria japonica]
MRSRFTVSNNTIHFNYIHAFPFSAHLNLKLRALSREGRLKEAPQNVLTTHREVAVTTPTFFQNNLINLLPTMSFVSDMHQKKGNRQPVWFQKDRGGGGEWEKQKEMNTLWNLEYACPAGKKRKAIIINSLIENDEESIL